MHGPYTHMNVHLLLDLYGVIIFPEKCSVWKVLKCDCFKHLANIEFWQQLGKSVTNAVSALNSMAYTVSWF
jgi:hypothetical protein